MDFTGVKVAVTGGKGFLGGHLVHRLWALGASVQLLHGDTIHLSTFEVMHPETTYLFHFGSPSAQVVFDRQKGESINQTLQGFTNAVLMCRKLGVKLVYPSTSLVSFASRSDYALCRQLCENIALGEKGLSSLGIRIFTGYGPGEETKDGYASVVTLFIQDALAGRRPTVFGDGSSRRDFIYVSDVVEGVLALTQNCPHLIMELGTGVSTSITTLLRLIELELGMEIQPQYVDVPSNFTPTTQSLFLSHAYHKPEVTVEEGIRRTIAHLREPKAT